MFFEARARERADELVALASAQIARARRRAATTGGAAAPAPPVSRGKSNGSAGTAASGGLT